MIRKKFVNREKELEFLGKRFQRKGLEFVIISVWKNNGNDNFETFKF